MKGKHNRDHYNLKEIFYLFFDEQQHTEVYGDMGIIQWFWDISSHYFIVVV